VFIYLFRFIYVFFFVCFEKGEEPVPVVDFGASGPIRCRRCGAYINPFCTFTDNGRSFICRVCEVSNEGKTEKKKEINNYEKEWKIEKPKI